MKIKEKMSTYLPVICLVLVIVICQYISGGKMLTSKALVNEIFTMAIGTTGMVFLLSQGCLDFSIASNVAMTCIIAAKVANLSEALALPAALLFGCMIGMIVGMIHAFLGVNSFIASLSVSFILTGIVEAVLQNGSASCPFDMLEWNTIPLRIGTMIAVMAIGFIVFEKTRVGKESKIVGANAVFANHIGINVKWVKIRGFMIMGLCCGLIAFFTLIKSGTASTTTGAGFEVDTLNALLIGGMAISGGATCRFRSAIIGACILGCLSLGMSLGGVGSLLQQAIEGIVYLGAICLTFDRKGMAVVK